MEKISKIIAGSPRVTSTDMSKERPVRAGTPSFGGPIAQTDMATRYAGLNPAAVTQAEPAFSPNYGSDAKLTEQKQGKMVKELEAKFFNKPSDLEEPVIAPKGSFGQTPDIAAEMEEASKPPATLLPQSAAPKPVDVYA